MVRGPWCTKLCWLGHVFEYEEFMLGEWCRFSMVGGGRFATSAAAHLRLAMGYQMEARNWPALATYTPPSTCLGTYVRLTPIL